MAIMLAHLNEALRKAGVDDETARKASEEVAGFENRLARVEADLTLLKWMVTFNIALTVAGFSIMFSLLWRLMP